MKKIIVMALISCSFAYADFKSKNCSAYVENTLVKIQIDHSVGDFRGLDGKIKSRVFISTASTSYELSSKKLNSDKTGIDFTSQTGVPYIDNTEYKISIINLFDQYPDLDRDDFFFGKIIHTDSEKNKYVTDFSRMGGELVVIFNCFY